MNFAAAAPAVFQAQRTLQRVVDSCPLDARLLDLVKLRASQINGCAFCIDMHVRDALAAGETPQRLALLDAWWESGQFNRREQAALRWAEAVTRLAGAPVTDADFAAARCEFSEEELAYLTLALVAINGWNRFNVAFRIPPGFAY